MADIVAGADEIGVMTDLGAEKGVFPVVLDPGDTFVVFEDCALGGSGIDEVDPVENVAEHIEQIGAAQRDDLGGIETGGDDAQSASCRAGRVQCLDGSRKGRKAGEASALAHIEVAHQLHGRRGVASEPARQFEILGPCGRELDTEPVFGEGFESDKVVEKHSVAVDDERARGRERDVHANVLCDGMEMGRVDVHAKE